LLSSWQAFEDAKAVRSDSLDPVGRSGLPKFKAEFIDTERSKTACPCLRYVCGAPSQNSKFKIQYSMVHPIVLDFSVTREVFPDVKRQSHQEPRVAPVDTIASTISMTRGCTSILRSHNATHEFRSNSETRSMVPTTIKALPHSRTLLRALWTSSLLKAPQIPCIVSTISVTSCNHAPPPALHVLRVRPQAPRQHRDAPRTTLGRLAYSVCFTRMSSRDIRVKHTCNASLPTGRAWGWPHRDRPLHRAQAQPQERLDSRTLR